MAWGPDQKSASIPEITDAGIKSLLSNFLRNGANIKMADGKAVHAATGQIVGMATQNTAIGAIVPNMITTGMSEDGQWAMVPSMTQFPSQSAPMQASFPAQQVAQYQQPQQQNPQPSQYSQPPQQQFQPQPGAQQSPYGQPVQQNSQGASTSAQSYSDAQQSYSAALEPTVQRSPVTRDVSASDVLDPLIEPARSEITDTKKEVPTVQPYVKCTPQRSSRTVALSWSCGSTKGKKVWVEGRGFDPRRQPMGSQTVPLPGKTSSYAIDCYNDGVVLAKASCVVKIPKKTIEILDYNGSFSVTKQSDKAKLSWCLFSKCLW
jgi:hypothetical protein